MSISGDSLYWMRLEAQFEFPFGIDIVQFSIIFFFILIVLFMSKEGSSISVELS